jgi:hypothetical protein
MSNTHYDLPYASSDESDTSYQSDSDSDNDDGYSSTSTHGTFASLAAALGRMSEQFADLDGGLASMESSVRGLERPAIGLTAATYSQPGVLESAPFRKTRFRLRDEGATLFPEVQAGTTTFSEICQAVRKRMLEAPTSLLTALELSVDASFLEVLNAFMHRMVA